MSAIYLGTLAVVPRSDIKRHFELSWAREDIDTALRAHLEQGLSLPKAPESHTPNALGLDVFVAGYQLGELFDAGWDDIPLPIAWRPRIEVSARLFRLRDKKPVKTFYVSRSAGWLAYFSRLLSWRHVLGIRTMYGSEDMKRLLDNALIGLLEQVRKAT